MIDLSTIRKIGREVICIVLLSAVMILIVLYEFDFMNRDFRVYEVLEGDRFGICATIQAIRDEGLRAAFFIDRWGAPEIASELCNPSVDLLTTIGIWITGWFTSNSACTFYVYNIVTFVLCAVCMYVFLRIACVNPLISWVMGAIYSLAPFHFMRISHTAFMGYYTIPLTMIIIYCIVDIDCLKRKVPKWFLLICAIIVGMGNPYYLFFGLILFALSYLIMVAKHVGHKHSLKEWLHLVLDKGWAFIIMCLTFFACQLPRLIYGLSLKNNYNVVVRRPAESEIYGLKLIQMVLPSTYHNSKFARDISQAYYSSGVSYNENITACLGLLGVLGLVILLYELYKNLVLKEKGFVFIDFLASANLLLLLVGTVGGLGTIFNYLVTPQFRCYNRISIFIACLCLTGLTVILDQLTSKNKIIGTITIIIILIVGLYDQVPLTPLCLYNKESGTKQKQLESFFQKIETSLDENAMVYQLPHMKFPENGPIYNLPDAQHFQGVVFTNSLRWSYGGIKGFDTAADELFINDGMSEAFLDGIVAAGFSGIYIDTDGYEDSGAEIISFYNDRGLKPIVSDDETLYFYNICDVVIDKDKVDREHFSVPGYNFIYGLSNFCGIDISPQKCVLFAEKLSTDSLSAAKEIYNWLLQYGSDDLNNSEYVNLLYTKILGRSSVAIEEINGWVAILENSTQSRLDILYSFLSSQEFQDAHKLNDFISYDTDRDIICFSDINYNADKYVSSGISYSENDYAWSDGNKIEFQRMKLSETGEKAYLFTLSLLGVYNGEQQVIIFCNGTEVMNRIINGAVELVIPITTDTQGIAELTISLPDAISPKEIGESNDTRELALQLEKIQISQFTVLEES